VAGSLGSRAVFEAAGVLESALRRGDPEPVVAEALAGLNSELAGLIATLRPILFGTSAGGDPAAETSAAAPPSAERTLAAVAEMLACLSGFDPAAQDCLEREPDVFASLFTEGDFALFRSEVELFAFSDAHARLRSAATGAGIGTE